MNIFRTKDVSLGKTEMHRHLKLWDLILLGIGAMVGTGIFTITGTAAATLAGPALVVSIVISAFLQNLLLVFLQRVEHIVIYMQFWVNSQPG